MQLQTAHTSLQCLFNNRNNSYHVTLWHTRHCAGTFMFIVLGNLRIHTHFYKCRTIHSSPKVRLWPSPGLNPDLLSPEARAPAHITAFHSADRTIEKLLLSAVAVGAAISSVSLSKYCDCWQMADTRVPLVR